MRIGFDLRPAQGPSTSRGIGRYTRGLLQAMAQEAGENAEWVLIALESHPLPSLSLPPGTRNWTVTVPDETRPALRAARLIGKNGPAQVLHRALDRRALARIARRERLDALLLPGLFERAFFGADGLACPTIKVCHDLIPYFTGEAFGQGRLYGWLYRQDLRGLARAERVLAISEATRRDVLHVTGADPARVRTIHQGVDPAFRPLPCAGVRAARDRFSPDRPFFLASGGLSANKNLETVVDALGSLRAGGGHDVRLLVLGAPPDSFHPRRAEIVARAQARGLTLSQDVIFLPHVSDEELAALYAASVALVFPSTFEGFGLPPLECMACGSVAIVSNTTSLPEVAGDVGLLADPDDVPGIAALMARLLDEPDWRSEVAARGPAHAAQFSWPRAAAQTLALLREAAGPVGVARGEQDE